MGSLKVSPFVVEIDDKRNGGKPLYDLQTGGLFRLTRSVWEGLCQGGEALDGELRDKLIRHEVLVPEEFEVEKALRRRRRQYQASTTSFNLTIETGLACNLNCLFCYQKRYRENSFSKINPMDLVRKCCDIFGEKYPLLKTLNAILIGGEPLMNKKYVLDCIRAIRANKISDSVKTRFAMDTNGTLLDSQIGESVDWFAIPLTPVEDHDKWRSNVAGRGTYRAIMERITQLAPLINRLKRTIVFRYNLNAENVEAFDEFLKSIEKLKLNDVEIRTALAYDYRGDLGLGEVKTEQLQRVALRAIEWRLQQGNSVKAYPTPSFDLCPAYDRRQLKVLSDGSVAVCDAQMNGSRGSIFELDSLDDVWDSVFPEISEYDPFDDEECRSCVYLGVCGGKYFCKRGDATNVVDPCTLRFPYRLQEFLALFVGWAEHAPELIGPSSRCH